MKFRLKIIKYFAIIITSALAYLFIHQTEFLIQCIITFSQYTFIFIPILTVVIYFIIVAIIRTAKSLRLASMARGSGLFFYSPNHNELQRKKGDKFLKKVSRDCSIIRIWGATGCETFTKQNSPLHFALQTCQKAEIILAWPLSDGVEKRCDQLKMNVYEYRKEIYKSIKCLSDLKNKGHDVKLKMYQTVPLWKYVIIEKRYIWVQQYPPDDHVQYARYYAFERVLRPDGKEEGVYNDICLHFSRRWKSPRLGVYVFETKELQIKDVDGNIIEQKSIATEFDKWLSKEIKENKISLWKKLFGNKE